MDRTLYDLRFMLLFNVVNYVFILLCLYILLFMYVPFWVLFHLLF
jgi:hypothetical protein